MRAALDVLSEILLVREPAGAFEHEVNLEFLPRQLDWISYPSARNCSPPPMTKLVLIHTHRLCKTAVHSVESQKVSEVLDVSGIIHSDEVECRFIHHELQDCRPIRPRPLIATRVAASAFAHIVLTNWRHRAPFRDIYFRCREPIATAPISAARVHHRNDRSSVKLIDVARRVCRTECE